MIIRFSIVLYVVALFVVSIPFLFLSLLIKITSKGPALYKSDRVGTDNDIFKMYKFRTMMIDTPPVATHLVKNSEQFLTPIGSALRKYSLDEIPQLFNILKGDMSFVGPRPALYNQDDLITLRTKRGIHRAAKPQPDCLKLGRQNIHFSIDTRSKKLKQKEITL